MTIILGLIWLASGILGTLSWTLVFGRHWERLQSQKRRGENGVLREIALTALRRDALGLTSTSLLLVVLATSIAIDDVSVRIVVGRTLISVIAIVLGLLAYQTMYDEERVMNKIREQMAETPRSIV